MNWNIFKRVAALEQKVKDLTDFNGDHSRWIGKRLQDLEHQVYLQSRDPRIAALEQQVKDLMSFSDDGGRIVRLEEKVRQIENKLFIQTVEHKAFSEVDKAREARRLYHREWRKKNKLSEDARNKKNAYARAYYARTKGKKK